MFEYVRQKSRVAFHGELLGQSNLKVTDWTWTKFVSRLTKH